MGQGRSVDIATRRKIVETYTQRRAARIPVSYASIAEEFGVGVASVSRFLGLSRENGSLDRKVRKPRGPVKCTPKQRDQIAAWALAHPDARGWEIARHAEVTFGVKMSEPTVRRLLHERNIGKRRLARAAPENTGDARLDRTRRYKKHHRRDPESRPGRRAYPSDFTDAEWAAVEPLWREHAAEFPVDHELRDVLDALRYIGATGTPWRYLPHDFPPHATVRRWFDRWTHDGTIVRVNDALRRLLRRRAGREETPSLLIIDSLSVKSHEGGEDIGYDRGKKVRGRKRHIAVDTMGLPWFAVVHRADLQDRDGLDLVIPTDVRTRLPRLVKILADAGYQGRCEHRTLERTGVPIEIVRRRGDTTNGEWARRDGAPPTMASGFHVLPKRWIVERSHAWSVRRRRLARDYERTVRASEAWLELSFQHVLAARSAT